MWISHEDRDVMVLELFSENFQLRGRRYENDLRLECDYSFEARMESVADFSNCLCFCREVAVTGSANKLAATADRKNDLRQIWCKGDNAIYLGGQGNLSAGLVGNLPAFTTDNVVGIPRRAAEEEAEK